MTEIRFEADGMNIGLGDSVPCYETSESFEQLVRWNS